jgi:hypothetical protein
MDSAAILNLEGLTDPLPEGMAGLSRRLPGKAGAIA